MDQSPKLLDQVRHKIRPLHYSRRTEDAYADWIKRFILFHGKQHPSGLGAPEVEAFLTDLAVRGQVSVSTQNQAKSAILFLYREVLDTELAWLGKVVAAKQRQRLAVVLTRTETSPLLASLKGVHALLGGLQYGSGLRLLEALRLCVKDVEFERREILVRDGKGAKDRVTVLPESIVEPLQRHLRKVKVLHEEELAVGRGDVYLPSRWNASTQMRRVSGPGSTCFRLTSFLRTRARASSDVIIWTRRDCSAQSSRRRCMPVSTSPRRRIRCAIVSRPICWAMVTIFARCRNCWATRMFRLR